MKEQSHIPNKKMMHKLSFLLAFIMLFNIVASFVPVTASATATDAWLDLLTEVEADDFIRVDSSQMTSIDEIRKEMVHREDVQAATANVNQFEFGRPYVSPNGESALPDRISGGNILHAWNMSFNEIRAQLPYIAEAGFGTIQTSPIGDSIFQFPAWDTHTNRPTGLEHYVGTWWMLYQPRSFNIGNLLGTEEEFRALASEAAALGIHIIVDAIPNHTTSWWGEISPELRQPRFFHSVPGDGRHGSSVDPGFRYSWDSNINSWSCRERTTRQRLVGLVDFNTGYDGFQEKYFEFLGRIIDAGASGFRYDAMAHIEMPYPHDPRPIASDFWPNAQNFVDERIRATGRDREPFQYGEILHRFHADYLRALPGMVVSACGYGYHVRNSIIRGHLGNWNTNDFFVNGGAADRFVTWVESHDTFGNEGISRGITDAQMRVGWAIQTARAETTPLFLVRPAHSFVNNGQMFSRNGDGTYRNNWGHSTFYRDETIAAVNWFANFFIDEPEHTSTHGTVALIERGHRNNTAGIVIVNAGTTPQQVNFPVQMTPGIYECQVTGLQFTVASGRITGPTIPGQSVFVIYDTAEREPVPHVSANPGDTTFLDVAGITVTLTALNTTAQYFTISGAATTSATPFTNGQQITIGAGATPGDVFTLTLTGTDGEHTDTQTFTFTKGDPSLGIEIQFESNWGQTLPRIWAFDDDSDFFDHWNTAPQMSWDDEVDAWVFVFDPGQFPNLWDRVPFTVMFHNGEGAQTGYFIIHESTRIYLDGSTGPAHPREGEGPILPPRVAATPGSHTFFDPAGVTITLSAYNTTQQTFMRYGFMPNVFQHGDQITIGEGASPGDVFRLDVMGENAAGESVMEVFTYIKGDPDLEPIENDIRIEFVHPTWNQVRIWAWCDDADFFTSWNTAPLMTFDADVNAWVFTFEVSAFPNLWDRVPFTVMFHNGLGGSQNQTQYFTIYGSSRIENGVVTGLLPPEPAVPTVTTRFVNQSGAEVAPTVQIEGEVGDAYRTHAAIVPNYVLAYDPPANTRGTFIDGEIIVTYIYRRIPRGRIIGGGSGDDGSTTPAVTSHIPGAPGQGFSTNARGYGQFVSGGMRMDGTFSDWTDEMRIAQSVAGAAHNAINGPHEFRVTNTYALYAAWSDDALYMMWQFVNTADVTQYWTYSHSRYPVWQFDMPMGIAINTGLHTPAVGDFVAPGQTIWGAPRNAGTTFTTDIDTLLLFSTRNGAMPGVYTSGPRPDMFIGHAGDDGFFSYGRTFADEGIVYGFGRGNRSSSTWGINRRGGQNPFGFYLLPEHLYDPTERWVDFQTLGTSTDNDSMYEIRIPLDALGITRSFIETQGIGAMQFSTWGLTPVSSIPWDPGMLEGVLQSYSSDQSTSAAKETPKNITVPLARIGATLTLGGPEQEMGVVVTRHVDEQGREIAAGVIWEEERGTPYTTTERVDIPGFNLLLPRPANEVGYFPGIGDATIVTFVYTEDDVSITCDVRAEGQFAAGETAGSLWRLCEDGTLEVDEGFINWTGNLSPWHAHRAYITQVDIRGPIRAGTSLRALFRELTEATAIVGLTYFDTSATRDMHRMFFGASGLTTLDVTSFDTSNVVDMAMMFREGANLEILDVSSFDTSNVTDMREMFRATGIRQLDLTGFNTSSVLNMNHMFVGMTSLRALILGDLFTPIGNPGIPRLN